ncbi:hypothetical protein EXU48_08485 [Occultella glacieicola]|uniref:Heparinase II/III-like protein n=1 Tax=Occultella glacieicola TaxID=2518684 RepID=A0ABY2E5H6_9MICO|nr:hypothetical protein EXU48_08485 [Occultella glacieicola]
MAPLTRRGFLGIGAATLTALGAGALVAPDALATSEGTVLPLVDPLPDGAPDRAAFAPNEQVFGQYLQLLAPLANSVVDDDPELFGWMEDGWWRTPNHPRNSRIMEHVSTLSWFLVNERSWNPYYLDPNLEGRLDAAIGYYLGLQGPRGAWPVTYEEESLATTGFGLVSLGNLQRDLIQEDLLPDRQVELEASMRHAAQWLMDTSLPHWDTPLVVTNQLVGGLAGVGHASVVIGDPQLAADLDDRIALLAAHGQAPAGYFHDPLVYDSGYNSTVMMPDLADLYLLTGNQQLVEMARKWADFAQYAILPEPGAPGWVHFAAASARNSTSTLTLYPDDARDRYALARAFVPEVPNLGLYSSSREDKAASRADWAASTEPIPPLVKPNASPRLYMHVPIAPENLGRAELDALTADLRPVAEDVFTEYREGTVDQQMLFVRRPGYYLASLLGRRWNDRIRSGTGMLWHPRAGTVVLSLNNVADDHWTTMTASGRDSALTDLVATFHNGADAGGPELEPSDLGDVLGPFTARYLSVDGAVTTDVVHRHDGIVRAVSVGEAATEVVPLFVQAGDVLEFSDGTVVEAGGTAEVTASWFSLTRGDVRFLFSWGGDRSATVETTSRAYFPGRTHTHTLLRVAHEGDLTMEITTIDTAQTAGPVAFSGTAQTWAAGGGHHAAVHAVNLDTAPVDLRIVTSAGVREVLDVAPGAGAYELFSAGRQIRAVTVIATTRGGGHPRVHVQRVDAD